MEFVDYITGKGNKPGEIEQDVASINKARQWNDHFKDLHEPPPDNLKGFQGN